MSKTKRFMNQLGTNLLALAACFALADVLRAADHGDTPTLINANRRDALLTDYHVFTRDNKLVLSVCMNPAIPPEATSYTFASDLVVKIVINRSTPVSFDNAGDLATYGGTILDNSRLRKSDIELTFTFANPAAPLFKTKGLPLSRMNEVRRFYGLRDDPFIRGPRQSRNVAAIVVEMPLDMVTPAGSTILTWVTSQVPSLGGPFQDMAGRALRSMFPENDSMNSLEPWQHASVLGLVPDVVIFDTSRPVAYPNGRELAEDVVDIVADPRVLMNDAPFPATNDLPFLAEFPYLSPPHSPPANSASPKSHPAEDHAIMIGQESSDSAARNDH